MHQRASGSSALRQVIDELRELFPSVVHEVAGDGPRVMTPEMSRFVVLSAERARLTARR